MDSENIIIIVFFGVFWITGSILLYEIGGEYSKPVTEKINEFILKEKLDDFNLFGEINTSMDSELVIKTNELLVTSSSVEIIIKITSIVLWSVFCFSTLFDCLSMHNEVLTNFNDAIAPSLELNIMQYQVDKWNLSKDSYVPICKEYIIDPLILNYDNRIILEKIIYFFENNKLSNNQQLDYLIDLVDIFNNNIIKNGKNIVKIDNDFKFEDFYQSLCYVVGEKDFFNFIEARVDADFYANLVIYMDFSKVDVDRKLFSLFDYMLKMNV